MSQQQPSRVVLNSNDNNQTYQSNAPVTRLPSNPNPNPNPNPNLILSSTDNRRRNDDPRLNFFSPHFDPQKALNTPNLQPPFAAAQALAHLGHCRPLLPEDDPEYRPQIEKVKSKPKPQQPEQKEMGPPVIERFTTTINIPPPIQVKGIKATMKEGPLALLRTLFERKCKVKLWIRRWKGVRGTLTGFIIAFDKHMNMILMDVEEDYTRFQHKCIKSYYAPKSTNTSSFEEESELKQPTATASLPTAPACALASVSSEPTSSGSTSPDQRRIPTIDELDATSIPIISTFSPPPSTSAAPSEMEIKHIIRRYEVRKQRHINQLYVRGDNIVMVAQSQAQAQIL